MVTVHSQFSQYENRFQSAPQFVRPLPGDIGEVEEGATLHLECQIAPVSDNTMQIYWLKDGKPIPTGVYFIGFFLI